MCNQLLLQFSRNVFQTLQTNGDILKMCMWVWIELGWILIELRPFELSHFWQLFCMVGYGVCVINYSYSFQRMFFKLCRHIGDILKMCMWVFDGARINFERITAF